MGSSASAHTSIVTRGSFHPSTSASSLALATAGEAHGVQVDQTLLARRLGEQVGG
jgi:hypothetical protein